MMTEHIFDFIKDVDYAVIKAIVMVQLLLGISQIFQNFVLK